MLCNEYVLKLPWPYLLKHAFVVITYYYGNGLYSGKFAISLSGMEAAENYAAAIDKVAPSVWEEQPFSCQRRCKEVVCHNCKKGVHCKSAPWKIRQDMISSWGKSESDSHFRRVNQSLQTITVELELEVNKMPIAVGSTIGIHWLLKPTLCWQAHHDYHQERIMM